MLSSITYLQKKFQKRSFMANKMNDLNKINKVNGGVTAASHFYAYGIKAGIKDTGKEDLGVLFCEKECSAAGTFTTNAIRASSVDWCENLLPDKSLKAIVCNSGCANACTGEKGKEDTETLAHIVSENLSITKESVLVASTGIIGKYLPMEKIKSSMPQLTGSLLPDGGKQFASAILTTDTVIKESAFNVKYEDISFTIGGCAKGSGMINPDMATMLAFITTDAEISSTDLSETVKRTVNKTFNNLTVDGDTSTNDMVLVLANGMSGVRIDNKTPRELFEKALFEVCNDLCKQIAADGEGATKRVEIKVTGARNEEDARAAAKAVANSNLTKCALFGNDPNWGRIACAVGYSGAEFSKESMTIYLCRIPVFKNLQPLPFDEKEANKRLKEKVVSIDIDLGIGDKAAVTHTCDFSYDYVKINAEYHT
jgi:glutamate N-acetyltransferase / amino-acid N-acetyltransferase